ncbi:hypothetical protein [Haliangium ochraceum]|uniref:Putative lipoprotein n=1 Tax=Haliangium ochraceum (strain DSM 14365 / JCM 11303 / SMP-2) TaxID=502025 RepID=D0LZF5_HALO1|nr:hypothetical protein [Haliangium ochraceum]ACY16417.1 putative lipoprotein [Haliangium ochraceum DSM 14365]
MSPTRGRVRIRTHVLAMSLAAALSLGGCAIEPGGPFATLEAELAVSLARPADRALEDGWQALASSYHITIDALVLELGSVDLRDGGSGGSLVFDPAAPPPGYTLCHNGHCHSDDGRLVPYEEIAAELGGDDALPVIVSLPVGAVDAVAGESRALACTPGCDLPLANIALAELALTRITASGRVRDGRAAARLDGERAWQLDLALDAAPGDDGDDGDDEEGGPVPLSQPFELPSDRNSDPDVHLTITLAPSSRLFDGVDWAALAAAADDDDDSGQAALLPGADNDARAALREALGELSLGLSVDR